MVQGNKFLVHVKNAEVWGKNKLEKKYSPIYNGEKINVGDALSKGSKLELILGNGKK